MANYSDIKYQAAASSTAIYADMAALIAATGMSAGDQALVTALNKVFMYTGSAWYLVATMTNASPTAITGVDGSYALELDGTATTITAVSTDPEGFSLTWSYAVTTGSLGSTATVSQADNVFTITPSSTPADAGSFSITFSVTDGATGAVNAVSAFTLAFSITNTRYTALSVKATATGSNQTFDDASASNHTITVAGDTTAATFSPYRHGGYSLGLDGTNDYLQVPQTTDLDLTGDFTVECWAYFNDTAGGSGLMGKWSGAGLFGWTLYATATDFWFYTGNSGTAATQGAFTFGAPAVNQWYHLAISRTGSTISTYVNGTRTTTITDSNNCTANTELTIGSDGSALSAWSLNGYMRDVRIVNGTGLYTGTSFAVPTEPLTAVTNTKFLLGDLPYFKDQSTSNHAIAVGGNASLKPFSLFDNAAYSEASHGASAYFDGSGDYLSVPDHEDFNMGSENFTAECWIRPTASPSQPIIMGQWSGSYSWALEMSNNSSRYLRFLTNAGSIVDNVSSTAVPLNQWSHVALVRNGTSFVAYLNGTSVVSSTVTGALANSTDAFTVGANASGSYAFQGYMSDVRVVKGTAVYTSNFTPPTAPLTAITNTKFLLNPETSISDLSQGNALKCIGNAATSTTQVKFAGTKSIYLDGNVDYITAAEDDASFSFGTGDFTVECWLYHQNASALYYDLVGTASNANYIGSNRGGWIFAYYHTISSTYALKFGYQYNNAFPDDISFSKTLNADTWYHLAMTRQGNQLKCFADGIQVGSTVTNSTNIISTEPLTIGTGATVASQYVTGYMQDIRVTKGLARYTSNFTPPTAELEG